VEEGGVSINQRLRFKIFTRDDFTCQPAVQLHVDHRFPKSKGGTDDEENLVTACIRCNSGKSADVLPIEVTYEYGPLAEKKIRTTEYLPLIWVWRDVDGGFIELLDGIDDDAQQTGSFRKVKVGPSWLDRPPELWEPLVARLRFRQSDGATSQLIGAYVASDAYPFPTFPVLTWMEPWQLLLDFDFNDGRRQK
jgi:hypothetical protein